MQCFFSKLRDAYPNNSLLQKDSPQKAETNVSLGFSKLLFSPLAHFFDHGYAFLGLSFIYGSLMSICALLFGFSYLCSFQEIAKSGLYCSSSALGFFFYSFLKFLFFAFFICNFQYNLANNKINWKNLYYPNKPFFKTIGALLLGLLIAFVPLVSVYLMWVREPNPNWHIEVLVFFVLFLGVIFPFFCVYMLPLLSFSAMGEKWPSFKSLWQKNKGNGFRVIFVLFIMSLAFIILSSSMLSGYLNLKIQYPIYQSFMAEFIYNFLLLLMVSWFVCLSYVQKKILYGENNNEK